MHGGFWLLSDDEYRIGPSIAENLVQDGVAVALLRYRLAPAYRHPAQAEDVAAGVAHLIKNAEKYGFDPKRIFLAGHSAGGHLASLVALDARYLNQQGMALNSIAGVISISGLYDLAPTWDVSQNQKSASESTFGKDPAILKSASPIHHVRAGAPRFFILSAFEDFPGFALDARRFADALRKAGNQEVDQLMLKGADHFTSVKLDDDEPPGAARHARIHGRQNGAAGAGRMDCRQTPMDCAALFDAALFGNTINWCAPIRSTSV